MAFPRKHLNDGEELIIDIRPHWIFLAPSVGTLIVAILVGLWIIFATHGTVRNLGGPVIGVALLVVLVWFGIRYAKWLTTEFAVTNFQVMSMTGVLNKKGRQIPLDRINSVEYSRKFLERLVGAGDLIIESASSGGRETFEDIRHPDAVQLEINRQIRRYRDDSQEAHAGVASAPVPVADQLEKLDELRRNGVLSEAEFQAQKARLLKT